ncbi:MAG: M56 family metallopeptidase [Winogradskyella sp.]
MLYTILQILAFQAFFLLIYDVFLKHDTFFNCNRAYLLITSVLAIVLPFIQLPQLQNLATKNTIIRLPEVFIGAKTPTNFELQIADQAGIVLEQPPTPIWQIIGLVGIGVAALVFSFKMAKIFWLKHKNPKRWQYNVLIVRLVNSNAAYSFFNTIFIGERIIESEKPTIYKHELVHVKELHTLDLLFFELLKILFWFNPLVYIYQNRIKTVHEYIADAKAVKESGKTEYYKSLLYQVFDSNSLSFTNTFFKQSLIKKRIVMLQKTKSKPINLFKYALVLPLVFGMLIYTATEVKAQQKTTVSTTENQELTDDELIQKYYDEIVAMKKNGATFFEISDYAGLKDSATNNYIVSREQYLKFKAYFTYINDKTIKRKSEAGTLTDEDLNNTITDNAIFKRTYKEHLEWKKTDDAKERWELNTQDGVLKLVVNDLDNKTKDEQTRFDALMKQLNNDTYFKKLLVCEANGVSNLVIQSYNNSNLDLEKSIEIPFAVIDEVPTLPECKALETNNLRKKCMSKFINKHVNTNFNVGVADSLFIKGKQRIFVAFKIDAEGMVKDVKARAAHPDLEIEAKRVINKLPQFIPGKQKGKTVVVPYSLPIVFEIKTDKTD